MKKQKYFFLEKYSYFHKIHNLGKNLHISNPILKYDDVIYFSLYNPYHFFDRKIYEEKFRKFKAIQYLKFLNYFITSSQPTQVLKSILYKTNSNIFIKISTCLFPFQINRAVRTYTLF